MMKVIKKVKQKVETFKFNDYLKCTEKTNDVLIEKGGLKDSYLLDYITPKLPKNLNFVKGYCFCGRYFVYCDDGFVYECLENQAEKVMLPNRIPCATPFTVFGKEKILFADGTDS